jgi:hypothetical protein
MMKIVPGLAVRILLVGLGLCAAKMPHVRPLYCLGAEQVEVVRGGSLSGLLLIWTNDGRPRMAFEYLSADERIEGDVVMLSADRDRERAVRTARQQVSSFRLTTSESSSN